MEHASDYSILWWALLFGACFGGNITVVGSTANIVALGLLEKRGHAHIAFFEWLKIGLFIGVLTGAITWGMLNVMEMPRPLYAPSPVKAETARGAPLAPSPAQ